MSKYIIIYYSVTVNIYNIDTEISNNDTIKLYTVLDGAFFISLESP